MTARYFGVGSLNKLGHIIRRYRAQHLLLVTGSHSFDQSGARGIVMPRLRGRLVMHTVVASRIPECSEISRQLRHVREHARSSPIDLVIAVGGGKVIDTAKLLAALINRRGSLNQLAHGRMAPGERPPLVAIPTTAGSGSEATQFAVLYDKQVKYSVSHHSLLPDVVIIDPRLIARVPANVMAASGLDAFCQAIESYWSVGATPRSKRFAASAIRIAHANLELAVRNSRPSSRSRMALAAHLAGKAINSTRTTAPHALSYVLTAHYGIPHGHAAALWLAPCCRLHARAERLQTNDPRGPAYIKRTATALCRLLGCPDLDSFATHWVHLLKRLGLAHNLHAAGIAGSTQDTNRILHNINADRLANHPLTLTRPILKQLIADAFHA